MTQSNSPEESDENSPKVKNEGGINAYGGTINTINYFDNRRSHPAPTIPNASPSVPSGEKFMPLTAEQKKQMRQFMVERYNLQELRTLCEDLDEDFDNLAGEGKEAKARELIAYLERRRNNVKLLKVLQDEGFNFN